MFQLSNEEGYEGRSGYQEGKDVVRGLSRLSIEGERGYMKG